MAAKPRPLDAEADALARAEALNAACGELHPREIIERAVTRQFAGEIAAVSSFGADSAVLLHMIAQVDHALPVIFLDTGKHFGETLEYRDALASDLGLSNLRIVTPEEAALKRDDPDGKLHLSNTDACCAIRKVEPMARGVEPFSAWFTGRKRFQAATRAALPAFEAVGPRIRINPLARWSAGDLADYMRDHGLRENPLVAYGYLSIGCFPCTQPVKPGEDARSGRWAGQAKTECGIHLAGLDRALSN
ncbi:phosphoadenylylsulfate reductase (thioredoxin) [Pseudaminobacter salicylatoxidans]|uniref:Adenosine 5'-phosphosulfate reductase n=1 Tax=Pseudaminobacter salicylatoxidans TaxID=93369 RepID=A0A316C4G7_PSESE|nr:phosphoadenylyl-sulfate reductase [Pseudaminobacter salicylatoxidans]PWJ84193.1 phosphoadenylylsulfate reductase (thioredoxin) [Pseudaminobacter salicylatoxidans]